MKSFLLVSLIVFSSCSKSTPDPKQPTPVADTASDAQPGAIPAPIAAAVAAPDRDEKDRALDAGRKPAETLAFFKVAPGQKIEELFSATGYTTEVIARVVGDTGKVYAQNSTPAIEHFGRKVIADRLAKPVMKNTVMVERAVEAPFPDDAKNLDAVICVLNYHDFVWQKIDRTKLNAAVFAALKPGGIYGIVDHSSVKGKGLADVETIHRIDEDSVKAEITAAGFKLDGEGDFLRNPADPRDWNTSPKAAADAGKRGTSDRFVLRFVKP